MNISQPFIRRPIATSLLMLGMLVFGVAAYGLLPVAALPNVDFPTITVSVSYPGASPDDDGLGGRDPARAAIRRDPRARPDDLDERPRHDLDHAAIRPVPQHRRGGAGRAAGDQRRQRPAADRPADPADLPQDQPRRPPGADLRRPFRQRAALPCRRLRLYRSWRKSCRPCRAFPRRGFSAKNPTRCMSRSIPGRWPRAASASRTCAPRSPRPRSTSPRATSKAPTRSTRSTPTTSCSTPPPTTMSSSPIATARRCGSRMSARRSNSVQNDRTGAWYGDTPAEGLAIQRQAGANTVQLVDTIKAMMPQLEEFDPAFGQGRPGLRPLADDPRRGARRSVHDDADGRARGPRHLFVPAHLVGDDHPEHGGAAVAAGNVRDHVRGGLQPRQHLADGADDLGRLCRRRRDRDDREHRALHRRRACGRSTPR